MTTNTQIHYELTPEQLALAEARKEKKLKQALAAEALAKATGSTLLSRPWLTLPHPQRSEKVDERSYQVKIFSWNLLAQCLIRRELFPTSDCLKANQRESIIHAEIRRQDAQIICLQEVDRLERLLPMLEDAGYSPHYASGPRKRHGCLIAFKKDSFSLVSENIVYYDDQHIGTGNAQDRIGATFKTRNIGYMMALRSNKDEKEGVVVATTHLFWHPRYTYERLRQSAILVRETSALRRQLAVDEWPCIIAGDFNFTPSDPAYSLLTGDALLPSQEEVIPYSMVVHSSLDPTILINVPPSAMAAEGDETEDIDPDRHITNARAPVDEDGLLSIPELVDWFSKLPKVRSAYNDGLRETRQLGRNIPTYGTRVGLPSGRYGADEPEYTSYTHYWQAVLGTTFQFLTSSRLAKIRGQIISLSLIHQTGLSAFPDF
ncbi:Endonuclease/exonuclease/phosphatase [Flammula alnicola]|nr:Endonuclease/exonuclease/phosphatase [Flammula alnicola]